MTSVALEKSGKIETRLSMAFMVILLIIGAGVIMRQFRINPGVIALRPEAQRQAMPISADQAALVDISASGLIPFSSPERFGPDALYEKIDGRADLYLSSGFVSLNTQRFTVGQTADDWMELFVYDMATAANAFSVFSMQRREGAPNADIVPNAYRTENALFMTHGKYYLEIIGTAASESQQKAMETLARGFLTGHGGEAALQAPGAGLFPAHGLQADSLQLIGANAFGYEPLDRVYACEYRIDEARLKAFVSERQDAEAASGLRDIYRQTLVSYGATIADTPPPIEGAVVMQFFDTYEIVFSRGRYLAGIHEAGDLSAASRLAGDLAAHLEILIQELEAGSRKSGVRSQK